MIYQTGHSQGTSKSFLCPWFHDSTRHWWARAPKKGCQPFRILVSSGKGAVVFPWFQDHQPPQMVPAPLALVLPGQNFCHCHQGFCPSSGVFCPDYRIILVGYGTPYICRRSIPDSNWPHHAPLDHPAPPFPMDISTSEKQPPSDKHWLKCALTTKGKPPNLKTPFYCCCFL